MPVYQRKHDKQYGVFSAKQIVSQKVVASNPLFFFRGSHVRRIICHCIILEWYILYLSSVFLLVQAKTFQLMLYLSCLRYISVTRVISCMLILCNRNMYFDSKVERYLVSCSFMRTIWPFNYMTLITSTNWTTCVFWNASLCVNIWTIFKEGNVLVYVCTVRADYLANLLFLP